MILRFSHCKSGHVTVEANPFVLRMGVLDFLRFGQRRLEDNFHYTSGPGFELFSDIYTMVYEHVVALEYCLAIELDRGESIEAIECKDMPDASTCLCDRG
jgi:hypothetical protein